MSSSVTVERHLSIPMRDGVLLSADLYRPSGSGALPTLLQRTPYNKSGPNGVSQAFALRAAEAGFAVIVQDVRGRFNSSGAFTAFDQEQLDGFDSCEWITGQAWSSGRIGMFGGSYVGLTQWQAVLAGVPGLQAIAPGVTASNYHDGWTYQGGAFNYYFNYSWGTGLATETASRRRAVDPASTGYDEMILRADGMDAYITQTPLNHDQFLLDNAAYYQTWLDHPSLDSYWDGINVAGRYGEIDVATLNMGGWHDIFLGGTLANYLGMHWHGKTEQARAASRLIVGPWSHATFTSGGAVGDYWPGVLSSSDAIDLQGIQLRFFDRWLRDADNGYEKESPVSIFVMGENRWRNEASWPLARATALELFLGSGGRANSLNGDGALLRDLPSREQSVPDHYLSDPRDPVPTTGGQLCCNMHWSPSGVYDQRKIESRSDVLVYTMDPVDEPTEITGPVTLILYAASSAFDCDWTAKLVDVCPCGCAYNLTDGILRARYRDSMREPTLLAPGGPTRFEVDLWATSVLLVPGHALRLEIASSNFPRFDRNLQTGGDQATTPLCEAVVAHQTVFHDTDYPSRLVVQVVAGRRR